VMRERFERMVGARPLMTAARLPAGCQNCGMWDSDTSGSEPRSVHAAKHSTQEAETITEKQQGRDATPRGLADLGARSTPSSSRTSVDADRRAVQLADLGARAQVDADRPPVAIPGG
jgi:hypothetical protein